MTRKECIDFIKSNGYGMEATEFARKHHGMSSKKVNYTHLSDELLNAFVEKKKAPKKVNVKKPVKSKKVIKAKPLNECVDENARKAIIAIAELIGYKNIKKFFN